MPGRMLPGLKPDVQTADTNKPTFSQFRSGLPMSQRQRTTNAVSASSSGTRMSENACLLIKLICKLRVSNFVLVI